MQATASVSYSSLLRYKITEERCSLQLNTINKDLKMNIDVVTHLPADCLSWKCLAHLWTRVGIMKVDMQERFILVSQIPLVLGELRTTEHRTGFVLCSLNESKWDYWPGHARGKHTVVAEGHKEEVPSFCAIFSKDADIRSWVHIFVVEPISCWL